MGAGSMGLGSPCKGFDFLIIKERLLLMSANNNPVDKLVLAQQYIRLLLLQLLQRYQLTQ